MSERPGTGDWRDRLLTLRRLRSRWRPGVVAVAVLVGAAVGFAGGRASAPTDQVVAARAVEERLLPLVIDADGIWTSPSGEQLPVAEALVALRRDGAAADVEASLDGWLASYDSILLRLAGVDLPAAARPVQRQFISAVTLSRDAVEVLGRAASVEDLGARSELVVEVARLRQRSEQLTQAARASVADLAGQRADVAPPSPVSAFGDGS
jgi:uncharacterized protein YcbX